jgi:succinyl-CoA:(S)-malate CoA-transferase subunit A/succinyl-CoA:(S)-malate CoA-transferase subunit B
MSGIRVLDIATFIAAPYAATIMSEFGAEVIKVENPKGGDPWRRYGTPTDLEASTLAWLSEARNKQSITLNLRTSEGIELFKKLVKSADVVCENFRPGTLEKWGIGWGELKAINPSLVLMRISGYGQTGPYKDRPGFARIAHAFGGLTHLSGLPGEMPVTPGSTSLGDYMSGLYGAIGILMALRHRDSTGVGQIVDMALYESVFRALDEIVPRYAKDGFVRGPEGTGTLNACPHGHFATGDGKFMSIACTTDKMFERLTGAMGRPDLWLDFGDQAKRLAARDQVIAQVTNWTTSMSRKEVLHLCVDHEVPAGAINSIADIFEDTHFKAREDIVSVPVPGLGDVMVPGVFPKLSKTPGKITTLGPLLGSANQAIYGDELGLSAADIETFKRKGVI